MNNPDCHLKPEKRLLKNLVGFIRYHENVSFFLVNFSLHKCKLIISLQVKEVFEWIIGLII